MKGTLRLIGYQVHLMIMQWVLLSIFLLLSIISAHGTILQ